MIERNTLMNKSMAEKAGGEFCVVIKTDGSSEVKKLNGRNTVFDEAKGFIGCEWIDHVVVQDLGEGVCLEYLVNDNGYSDWGCDPKMVNQIATFLHERGKTPQHNILGNVVMCLSSDGDEGGEFIGMDERLAKYLKSHNDEKLLPKAKEVVKIPEELKVPDFKILSFDSSDDMIKYMGGDKSVKPCVERSGFVE